MSKKHERRTNKHHRLSRSRTNGQKFEGVIHGVPNVQMVDYKKHNAFHQLFTSTHPVDIAKELNAWWVDPNYLIVAVPKEDARKILRHLSQLT